VGCLGNPDVNAPVCATYAIGGTVAERRPYFVEMTAPQGDVTGHYLLRVYAAPGGYREDMTRPLRDVDPNLVLPEVDARERPAMGDVLGPDIVVDVAIRSRARGRPVTAAGTR